jgi:hypothetical protein
MNDFAGGGFEGTHNRPPSHPAAQAKPAGWPVRLEAVQTELADLFSAASRSLAFGSAQR